MKKLHIILYIILTVCFASLVSGLSIECYQESANVSTVCGGLNSGIYGFKVVNSYSGDMYINYSKPILSNENSLWKIKLNSTLNHTVSLNDCWDSYDDKIVLKVANYGDGPNLYASGYCYNTTDWINLKTLSSYCSGCAFNGTIVSSSLGLDGDWNSYVYYWYGWRTGGKLGERGIYEEAMNWNITNISIDNCSINSIVLVNFSSLEEETEAAISTTLKGNLDVSIDNIGWNQELNLSWANNNHHSICSDSSYIYNFTTNAQFEYDAGTDYEPRTYYFYENTLSNNTQYINLYSRANTTQVQFTVTDQDDTEVQEVYIHVAKYDIGTDSYKTVEILKTDESGKAVGNLILYTTWYKFFLYYNGEIKLVTDPAKILTTSRSFRINLQDDDFSHFDNVNEFVTSLTYNNATGNFIYTYSNPSGTQKQACLKVVHRRITLDTTINNSCETSASGTILVNIGTPSNGTYIATGTIQGSPNIITDMLEVSFEEGFKKWGKEGIFATLLLRITVSMIGIWNPIVAIVLLLLVDIGMIVTGLYYMSWTSLIVYIVLAIVTMVRIGKK